MALPGDAGLAKVGMQHQSFPDHERGSEVRVLQSPAPHQAPVTLLLSAVAGGQLLEGL